MTSLRRPLRPTGARARVLLVLAVLTGLVAMHGLGPVPMAQHERAGSAVSSHTATKTGHSHHTADTACHHLAFGHPGGGHLDHADATCAASGTSAGPALTAPVQHPISGADYTAVEAVRNATSSAERAPPSLSQLQLLRI